MKQNEQKNEQNKDYFSDEGFQEGKSHADVDPFEEAELIAKIDDYIEKNWEEVVADIDCLVRIPSIEDNASATSGAPFGAGPKQALDAALDLADRMGFATTDVDGYIGFADYAGRSNTQIGIIGHMDVVPAGPGWHVPPFEVTRKEGYLLGRGVLDDKGPSVVALHALKFWKDQKIILPYTVRFLFGTNEETGMQDVSYYRQRYQDPAFLFTPDADFPVCYGEKGGYDGLIVSKYIDDGVVVEMEGGTAVNAVPGQAHAIVRAEAGSLPETAAITLSNGGQGLVRIDAQGKSAHASKPETGINAIGILVDYLLAHSLCNADERAFFEFDRKLLDHTDGSALGFAASDEHFGSLTVIGGTIKLEGNRFLQTMDCRFPTTITGDDITQKMLCATQSIEASFENTRLMDPFLVQPDSPVIQTLLAAYREATGEHAEPFTMGGGTYAREFTTAASFGPEKPWLETPAWLGSMHGPDEGVSEELLKQCLKVYALTIGKLMHLTL